MANCYKPNINNPMGNFLPFDDRTREPVCNVLFKEHLDNLLKSGEVVDDTLQYKFNPQPVTSSYPDTTGFAKFLFPDPARCRETGYLCKTNAASTLNLNRIVYYHNYQEINRPPFKNVNEFKIGGHTN